MPLPIIAWLANVVFVGIPVLIAFLTLSFLVTPPTSVTEAILESHKTMLVGAVTLSGVALIEVILLVQKIGKPYVSEAKACLLGALILLVDMIVGAVTYLAAIMYGAHLPPDLLSRTAFIMQLLLGLVLLAVAVCIALKFKYIDCRISDLEAAKLTAAGKVPAE